jgi:hypothetical protein
MTVKTWAKARANKKVLFQALWSCLQNRSELQSSQEDQGTPQEDWGIRSHGQHETCSHQSFED